MMNIGINKQRHDDWDSAETTQTAIEEMKETLLDGLLRDDL